MKNFDKAVVINSVTLSDYTFGKDAAKKDIVMANALYEYFIAASDYAE